MEERAEPQSLVERREEKGMVSPTPVVERAWKVGNRKARLSDRLYRNIYSSVYFRAVLDLEYLLGERYPDDNDPVWEVLKLLWGYVFYLGQKWYAPQRHECGPEPFLSAVNPHIALLPHPPSLKDYNNHIKDYGSEPDPRLYGLDPLGMTPAPVEEEWPGMVPEPVVAVAAAGRSARRARKEARNDQLESVSCVPRQASKENPPGPKGPSQQQGAP
jgi:hypothetical protein